MGARMLMIGLAVWAAGCKADKTTPKTSPVPTASEGAATATSDAAPARTLEDELEAIRSENELPALAAAAWRGGALVEMAAVGLRKADDPGSKVTTADRWHLGSNTKAMTATLIGIYVDRGTLKWTDTVATLFEGWKIDPGYAQITLDQLIRHAGGAPGQPPDDLWAQLWADGANPDARAKFVKALLARPPAQKPGTFVYSNAGYMIAGAALEKATGKRWEDLIRDELFAKLGMTTCGFGAPGQPNTVDQPWGHDASGKPMAPGPQADNPPGFGPAGTVHCSLEDYGKFLAFHASGQPALVEPATLAHLHTAPHGGYAGGWIVLSSPKGSALAHSGSNTLWYLTAMVTLVDKPEDRLALVMVTNSGSSAVETAFGRLVQRHVKPSN